MYGIFPGGRVDQSGEPQAKQEAGVGGDDAAAARGRGRLVGTAA